MCKCNQKNKEAALDYLKKMFGDGLEVGDTASLVNQAGLVANNKLVAVGFDEYEVWVQVRKKDGSLGNSKRRKVPFVHSYCPHCGEKVEQ